MIIPSFTNSPFVHLPCMLELGDIWATACWNHVCRTHRELWGKVFLRLEIAFHALVISSTLEMYVTMSSRLLI